MLKAKILAVLIIAALSLGCSDDSDSKQDSSVTGDLAALQDSGPGQDSAPAEDGQPPALMDIGLVLLDSGDLPWTCAQIAECQKACAQDTSCLGACSERGCASAKTANDALVECAIQECITSCVGGFNDACNACAAAACPEIYAACTSNTCD